MSCSTFDLKAYSLGEIDRREQAGYENHLAACPGCREEVQRLQLTRTALSALPDEEIPQRIAFVSDQVFEPHWWQTMWRSGPLMGFASAAILAYAILVHGFAQQAPVQKIATGPADTAMIQRAVDQEVKQRVDAQVAQAVALAVAGVERRQDTRDAQVLAAAEKRFEVQRRADVQAAQETINLYKNQMARMMVAANYSGRSEP